MRVKTGLRFWVELAVGTASLIMMAATSLWPQWIEAVLGLAPDADSGETEWGLTAGLCIFAVVMFVAARLEWRRITGAARTAA
jgi:hypothetical protein